MSLSPFLCLVCVNFYILIIFTVTKLVNNKFIILLTYF
ncbi:hypothetical protein TVCOMph1_CDS0038 [Terrisporobacter phage TVCOM_ph1]